MPALVTRIATGPSSVRTRSNARLTELRVGDVDLDGEDLAPVRAAPPAA